MAVHPLAQHLAARYDVKKSVQGELLQILAGMPLNVSTISSLKCTYPQSHANGNTITNTAKLHHL